MTRQGVVPGVLQAGGGAEQHMTFALCLQDSYFPQDVGHLVRRGLYRPLIEGGQPNDLV